MNPLPTLEELTAPLRHLGWAGIQSKAHEIGVPPHTLYRLSLGHQGGCNYRTAEKIALWASKQAASANSDIPPTVGGGPSAP